MDYKIKSTYEDSENEFGRQSVDMKPNRWRNESAYNSASENEVI